MKFSILILLSSFFSLNSIAATLECRTPARTATDVNSYWPRFSMKASVADDASVELASLTNVTVTAGHNDLAIDAVAADATYRPRANKNRVRLNFDIDASTDADETAEGDAFDGIVHGVLLPKVRAAGENAFVAYVISSTDSYHDGINSYFRMVCTVR